MKVNYIAGMIVACWSTLALAEEWSPVAANVTEINAGYTDGMILFNAGDTHNPGGCAASHYAAHPDYADTKDILSLLLYAKATNSKVRIAVSQTECGAWGYPKVTRIKLL